MAFPFQKKNHFIAKCDTTSPPLLSMLHKRVFTHHWGEETFVNFINDNQVFGFMSFLIGHPNDAKGFILCRLIGDEAEIITFAVDPDYRQRGIGQALLDATLRHLHHERAHQIFLEVDEKNIPAIQLYRQFNFEDVGRRPSYYQTEKGRSDAIIMRRLLRQT